MSKYNTILSDIQQINDDYLLGMTLAELEQKYGYSNESIRRHLKSYGTPLRPRGQPFGKYLPSGGRQIDKDGYVLISRPMHPNANSGGYVREHRLVVEESIGRPLLRSEVVHHINGIKSDNRIENLQLYSEQCAHKHDEMKGNTYSVGKGNKSGKIHRTPDQLIQAILPLVASYREVFRSQLKPPYPSYRALTRSYGHWSKAIELARNRLEQDRKPDAIQLQLNICD